MYNNTYNRIISNGSAVIEVAQHLSVFPAAGRVGAGLLAIFAAPKHDKSEVSV